MEVTNPEKEGVAEVKMVLLRLLRGLSVAKYEALMPSQKSEYSRGPRGGSQSTSFGSFVFNPRPTRGKLEEERKKIFTRHATAVAGKSANFFTA